MNHNTNICLDAKKDVPVQVSRDSYALHRKLYNNNSKMIVEQIEKNLSSWKGKYLSVGAILVLINSVVLEKIDYFRSCFFWQNDSQKKKYTLTKWSIIWQPKDQVGLGTQKLEVQNQCLLGKWLFKLINEEGLLETIRA
jgi:hypothetical protein